MTTEIQSKAVRRVVVLQVDPAGGYTPVTVYRKKSGKKKGSRLLRPVEKKARKLADAAAAMTESYTERHQRSNEKKKDGWVKDLKSNVTKAAKTGRKRAKIKTKLFSV